MSRPASAREVVAAVRALPLGRTAWIGIDGPGGAGKSTLAAFVAAEVPGVEVVRVDDFAGPAVPEWDWSRFRAQVVEPLAAGRPGRYRRQDWRGDAAGGWREVPVGSRVVVEGVSSTRREAGVAWDLVVWVDAPEDVRRQRTIARDGAQVWTDQWLASWSPSEQAYIRREQPHRRADLVVDGAAPDR